MSKFSKIRRAIKQGKGMPISRDGVPIRPRCTECGAELPPGHRGRICEWCLEIGTHE